MPDDIDATNENDRAFQEDRGPDTVYPYSFLRETAAEALGLRYGSLTEDDVHRHPNPDYDRRKKLERTLAGLSKKLTKAEGADMLRAEIKKLANEPPETITWDGMKRDAVIVLWLCSHPDSVCQKARRRPRDFEADIDKWADERRLIGNGPEMQKAIAEFSRIMAARNEGRGVPDIGDAKEDSSPNA